MRRITKIMWFILGFILIYASLFIVYGAHGEQASPSTGISVNKMSHVLATLERNAWMNIAKDMEWLVKTKPRSIREMLKDFRNLPYVPDKNGELKGPFETRTKGGDCEDFASYVIARLIQLRVGIRWGYAVSLGRDFGHAAAIYRLSNGEVFVVDPTASPETNQIFVLADWVEGQIMSDQPEVYIWWWRDSAQAWPIHRQFNVGG